MINLSPHFTLDEMTRSGTAAQYGIDNQPGIPESYALRTLCVALLEPLRARVGPLRVTSGYRGTEVNTLVGGVGGSSHTVGRAGDVVAVSSTRPIVWSSLLDMLAVGFPIDKIIAYERPDRPHVHIQIPGPKGARGIALVELLSGDYILWSEYQKRPTTDPTITG